MLHSWAENLHIMKCLDELYGVRAASALTSVYRSGLSPKRSSRAGTLPVFTQKTSFQQKKWLYRNQTNTCNFPHIQNLFTTLSNWSMIKTVTLIDFLHAGRLWPLKIEHHPLSIIYLQHLLSFCFPVFLLFRFLLLLDRVPTNCLCE